MLDVHLKLNYKQIIKNKLTNTLTKILTKILTNTAVLTTVLQENKLYFLYIRAYPLKSPVFFFAHIDEYSLHLSHLSIHSSAVGPVGLGFYLECFALAFLLQQFADISIAGLAPALVMAQAQLWNILYLLIIWELASVFLWHASCTSKTRTQLYEIELIKSYSFNPSLLPVRGHFSSPWAFSLLNCRELLYQWQ